MNDEQRIKISPNRSYVLRRISEGKITQHRAGGYLLKGFGNLDGSGRNAVDWLVNRGFACHLEASVVALTPQGQAWVQVNS